MWHVRHRGRFVSETSIRAENLLIPSASAATCPVFLIIPTSRRRNALFVSTMSSPLYAFGFGLSYTTQFLLQERSGGRRKSLARVRPRSGDVTNSASATNRGVQILHSRSCQLRQQLPVKKLKQAFSRNYGCVRRNQNHRARHLCRQRCVFDINRNTVRRRAG